MMEEKIYNSKDAEFREINSSGKVGFATYTSWKDWYIKIDNKYKVYCDKSLIDEVVEIMEIGMAVAVFKKILLYAVIIIIVERIINLWKTKKQ